MERADSKLSRWDCISASIIFRRLRSSSRCPISSSLLTFYSLFPRWWKGVPQRACYSRPKSATHRSSFRNFYQGHIFAVILRDFVMFLFISRKLVSNFLSSPADFPGYLPDRLPVPWTLACRACSPGQNHGNDESGNRGQHKKDAGHAQRKQCFQQRQRSTYGSRHITHNFPRACSQRSAAFRPSM